MPNPTKLLALRNGELKLIWLPIGVFVLAEATLNFLPSLQMAVLPVSTEALKPDVLAAEAAARFRFLALFLLLALSAAAIIWRFIRESKALFTWDSVERMFRSALVCICIGAIAVIAALLNTLPASFSLLGENIYVDAFKFIGDSRFTTIVGHPMSSGTFNFVRNGTALITIAAIACLIVSAISSLAEVSGAEGPEKERVWRFQSNRLQITIYISTALLVIGVLFVHSWAHWPEFILANAPESTDGPATRYAALADAYTAYIGVQYSLLLASFAIPVGLLMSERANEIAEDRLPNTTAPSPSEIYHQREAAGLTITVTDQLKTILAILAPFLAGTLGNIMSLIS